jgi:hypothetical protein
VPRWRQNQEEDELSLILLAAFVAMIAASCSSSEPLGFDLARPMAPPPVAVTISGEALDENVVCSNGTFLVGSRMEDMEGNLLPGEQWEATFESAVESGSVAEFMHYATTECNDGSGTITIIEHWHYDFAELDIESFGQGRINNGTWTLEGTGDYESLTGSGDFLTDFDEGMLHAVGEVEA